MQKLISMMFALVPIVVVTGILLIMKRRQNRAFQTEMNEVGETYGLRPTVARPGLLGLLRGKSPGLVGKLEGQEVWIGITQQYRRRRHEDLTYIVSLRLRVTPGLSQEFSATREGTANRLLQRFQDAEPQVGDEDLDALLHIRALGAGDREVLRLQSIQNGIFRLVTHLPFEFLDGALTLEARTTDDPVTFAEELLERARNLARALANDTMELSAATDQAGVWSV